MMISFLCATVFFNVQAGNRPQDGVVSCPVPIQTSAPKPMEVLVKIDGKGPFVFGFDSGQSIEFVVSPELSEKLGLKKTGEIDASDGTPGRSRKIPILTIPIAEVCGLKFLDTQAVQLASPDSATGKRMGTVGFPLFYDRLLTVNVAEGRIQAAEGMLPPADGKTVLTYRPDHGTPMLPIELGGVKIEGHIDTGAAKGILIPTKLQGKFKFKSKPTLEGKMATMFGESQIFRARIAGKLKIGNLTFDEPVVHISDLLPFVNVGRDVLRNMVLTFDQRNLRLKVERSNGEIIIKVKG